MQLDVDPDHSLIRVWNSLMDKECLISIDNNPDMGSEVLKKSLTRC